MSEVVDPLLHDAAKRTYDHINIHLAFTSREELKHKWLAIRLSDGGSDGTLYDSAKECASHQMHEQQCWYVSYLGLAPGGFTVLDIMKMLHFYREARDAGLRFVEDGQVRQPMMTARRNDHYQGLFERDGLAKLREAGGKYI